MLEDRNPGVFVAGAPRPRANGLHPSGMKTSRLGFGDFLDGELVVDLMLQLIDMGLVAKP